MRNAKWLRLLPVLVLASACVDVTITEPGWVLDEECTERLGVPCVAIIEPKDDGPHAP